MSPSLFTYSLYWGHSVPPNIRHISISFSGWDCPCTWDSSSDVKNSSTAVNLRNYTEEEKACGNISFLIFSFSESCQVSLSNLLIIRLTFFKGTQWHTLLDEPSALLPNPTYCEQHNNSPRGAVTPLVGFISLAVATCFYVSVSDLGTQ